MMRAVKLIALCALSYVGGLDIFIDGPVLFLDCRKDSGQHMTESTTTSVSTEAPVDPKVLFDAARDGYLSSIKTAISQMSSSGRDLNWHNPDHDGYTALHIATENSNDRLSIVAALLDAGADPDVQDDRGNTPIGLAVLYKHISVLRLLLDPKYQADVNLENANGNTPVNNAASSVRTAALELLLAHGGDPNKVDKYETSPLMSATEWGNVEAARMLIQARAHIDYADPTNRRTALHLAAGAGKADVARLLLEKGADKNKPDYHGRTPADFARYRGHDSVAQLIDNY